MTGLEPLKSKSTNETLHHLLLICRFSFRWESLCFLLQFHPKQEDCRIMLWNIFFQKKNIKKFFQNHFLSAYEVKINCSLFETLFKIQKNYVFLFGLSFFRFRDTDAFVLCKWGKRWRHKLFHLEDSKNTESRISLEILEQCSSKLAPEVYIPKETKCNPLCHCHDNTTLLKYF